MRLFDNLSSSESEDETTVKKRAKKQKTVKDVVEAADGEKREKKTRTWKKVAGKRKKSTEEQGRFSGVSCVSHSCHCTCFVDVLLNTELRFLAF